jgi:hypothetical protein
MTRARISVQKPARLAFENSARSLFHPILGFVVAAPPPANPTILLRGRTAQTVSRRFLIGSAPAPPAPPGPLFPQI